MLNELSTIQEYAGHGENALEYAEELGHVVDKDFVLELMIEEVYISIEEDTTTTIAINMDDFDKKIGTEIRRKIWELYDDNKALAIAMGHHYRDKRVSRVVPGDNEKIKRIKLPIYMRNILRSTGLIDCHSVKEIREFQLNEEHRERRKHLAYRGFN